MQVAASFIEYLITGCLTLIWLLPPVCETGICNSEGIAKQAFLLIPAAFVLGMVIDFVSKGVVDLISKPKITISKLFNWGDSGVNDHVADTAFVVLHSTDLGKEYQIRSSRDRIARGAFLNSLIVFVLMITGHYTLPAVIVVKFSQFGINIAVFSFTVLSFGVWWRFEKLSRRFRNNSVIVIREKLARETKK